MYRGGSGSSGSRRRPRDLAGSRGDGAGEDEDEDDRKPSARLPEGAEVIDLLDDNSSDDSSDDGDGGNAAKPLPSLPPAPVHVSISSSRAAPLRGHAGSPPRPRRRRRRRDDAPSSSSIRYPSASGASAMSNSNNITSTSASDSSRRHHCWTCPACTLHNPQTAAWCEACGGLRTNGCLGGGLRGRFGRASSSRSGRGGATLEEMISIDDTPPQQRRRQRTTTTTTNAQSSHRNIANANADLNVDSSPSSAYSYVGGGALLGGMLGATNAYLHGRPLGPAAARGAFAGGVGGAAVNVAMASSGATAASTGASSSRMATTGAVPSSQRPEISGTSTRSAGGGRPMQRNGSARAAGGDGGVVAYGRGYRVGMGGPGPGHADVYLRHLQNEGFLRSLAGPPSYHGGGFGGGRYSGHRFMAPDIDNMSYEQLLARFGDGTENQARGASAGQIASLPTSTVANPDGLPKDCRACIVCMESFRRGDVRRTLPCLHSEFHAECVDRWLQSNATCPVCKHRLE